MADEDRWNFNESSILEKTWGCVGNVRNQPGTTNNKNHAEKMAQKVLRPGEAMFNSSDYV